MTRHLLLISLSCGLLAGGASWTPTYGQSLFERFSERLLGEDAADAVPAPAAESSPGPASSYIGLVGDDQDTGSRGVRVLTVRTGSPAEKAGLQPGDLITGIGSRAVRSVRDMVEIVGGARPGESLEFTVERGVTRTTVTVVPTLRPPPDSAGPAIPSTEVLPPPRPGFEPPTEPSAETPAAESGRPYLGIRVAPLDPTTRREIPLLVRRGIVIRTIDPGSPAERAGLPVGGVIVAVDGQRIGASEELVAVMAGMRPGQEIEIMYYLGRTANRKRVVLAGAPDEAVRGPRPPEPDLPLLVPPTRGEEFAIPGRGPAAGDLPGGRILPGGDLPPAVREVERVIGGILRPRDAGGGAAAGGELAGEDVAALRAEVTTLRDQVRQLQVKLAELERRLAEAGEPGRE